KYPSELAGSLYPEGIQLYPQDELADLIKQYDVDECVFAYSDLPYDKVMGIGAIVNSAGANFKFLGTKHTMIKSNKPDISDVATRTATGKIHTSRVVVDDMLKTALKAISLRHPIPYRHLAKQPVHTLPPA